MLCYSFRLLHFLQLITIPFPVFVISLPLFLPPVLLAETPVSMCEHVLFCCSYFQLLILYGPFVHTVSSSPLSSPRYCPRFLFHFLPQSDSASLSHAGSTEILNWSKTPTSTFWKCVGNFQQNVDIAMLTNTSSVCQTSRTSLAKLSRVLSLTISHYTRSPADYVTRGQIAKCVTPCQGVL